MKTYKITSKQTKLLEQIKSLGYKAGWWGPNGNATRLYLNYRKDIKCWIEFDEPEECYGAALKIYIADCGQHPNWYKSQKQKIREWAADAFQAATGQILTEQQPNVVTEEEAENLEIGQEIKFLTGGQPGEDNPERTITGVVKSVQRQPAPSGTIGQDEQVEVVIDTKDGLGDLPLYTWRGILRYGSGAQIVRRPLN
jgi:hypothetical protein